MKIEPDEFRGIIEVDVQTRRDGNTAIKLAEDGSTEVTFGALRAEVLLRDLGIRVIMDPDGTPTQWKDIAWARAQAMRVLCRPDVAPFLLTVVARFRFELGRNAGREALQRNLRETLGIPRMKKDVFGVLMEDEA